MSEIIVDSKTTAKTQRSQHTRKRLLIAAGAAVALLLAGGAVYWAVSHKKTPVPPQEPAKSAVITNVTVPAPTAEQQRVVKETARGQGAVESITAAQLKIKLDGGGIKVLKVDSNSMFSSGSNGYPAQLSAIKPGQKAIVSYDDGLQTVLSLWVNYDAK